MPVNHDNIDAMLETIRAMPHTHKVVTTYADGRQRTFTTRSLKTAEMHSVLDRRNIGRSLISRETGEAVRIISVEVSEI